MRLQKQLGVLLLLAASAMPVTLALALWSSHVVTQEIADVVETERFVKSVAELRQIVIETVLFHEARSQDQWDRKIASMRAQLQRMPSGTKGTLAAVSRMEKSLDFANTVYKRIAPTLTPSALASSTLAGQGISKAELSLQARSIASLLVITSEISDTGYSLIEQLRREMQGVIQRIQIITSAFVLALGALLLSIFYITRKRVLQPLLTLQQGTERIAKGDYSVRLGFERKDEMGQLAQAFDIMTQRVQHAVLLQEQLNITLRQSNATKDAAMRNSGALLTTLNLHAIVSVADSKGDITEVNDAFCRISGYAREELIGKSHRIVNSGAHAQAFWEEMWHTVSAGTPWRSEVCNRAKDGSLYWLDTFIAPFIGDDGFVEKYISMRTDITANKAAESALIQATAAAQDASQAKSQFLANMSHELRTPMNAILGMLTLLRKTELTPRQLDYAAKSDRAARSLLGFLNDILDFSKVEAGKMSLDPHPFRVDHLLRDLSVIFSATAGAKPVEVLFDIDPTLPRHLVGDVMRLQQILINLGINAIKFTEKGEVVVSMSAVQRDPEQVTLKISVRDSGIGIAPENQARIFSGFTQAEASTTRRYGGTGLGVAISQRFVSLMGGELQLDSALGQGSVFHFTISLPLATDSTPSPAQLQPKSKAIAATPWRTLVVDDNPVARAVLERMGQSLDWQVDVASSGEAALELLNTQAAAGIAYQALFIDWQMPGLDGWQTCQRIRAMELPGEVPLVVMVTAHGLEMLSQRSPQDQALLDGYVVKPVTASMLFDAVMDARAGHNHLHPSQVGVMSGGNRLLGMSVLVVEDNLINQQVARELLQEEGATVWVANDGLEAIGFITATDPAFDVVLMDIQMPVMDGFTATRTIRQDLRMTQLPIIAITANAMASDREACLAAGMNDHVGKPFDLNHLVRLLRQHAGWSDIASVAASPTASVLQATLREAAFAAGVDLNAALNRLGGKQDVYLRMLRSFAADLGTMSRQLQTHIAAGNTLEASRILHTLKALAATLGVTDLASAAAQGETLLASQPGTPDLQAMAQQVCTSIATTAAKLEILLNVLQDHQASTAPVVGASNHTPLDTQALLLSLKPLEQLLQNSDMAALQVLTDVKLQFGQALGNRLSALEEAMSALNFVQALRIYSTLTESIIA